MSAAVQLATVVGVVAACSAMAIPRASFYRRRRPREGPPRQRPSPPRALSLEDRQQVLDVLHSDEFVDRAPAEINATLLDRRIHLCSVRTMYRILESEGEVRERRAQRMHPEYRKPELLATAPNQVWSWDITKLRASQKWVYFYLYVVIDIFSRYVVGWMLAAHENAGLAKRLLEESCAKQGIQPGCLVIHQDRGAPMTSKTMAQLYADLSVTPSYSRPHVSDDNPYSEAHFKTLKYRPDFPERFGSIEDAGAYCRRFFPWYNAEHRHSGIAYFTPEAVHYGDAERLHRERAAALAYAYAAHPERFVNGPPQPRPLPREAWINPPSPQTAQALTLVLPQSRLRPSEAENHLPEGAARKNEAPGCPTVAERDPRRPVPSPLDGPLLEAVASERPGAAARPLVLTPSSAVTVAH